MKEQGLKGLDEYVSIQYLEPHTASFKRTLGGFVSLTLQPDKEYARVNLHRAFPFSSAAEYISIRDMDGKEIGMIQSMADFPLETRELFEEEMHRRYFTPIVHKINVIKEEFGYSYWEVDTDSGAIRFTVKGGHHSIININEHRIMVVDVDGNRYEISNVRALDEKSYKKLETYL